ncbi:MAG: hypothetical protein JXA10_03850 [Anaerolineae bacterium]|nr:hypothetical protein [Anaerolineae bacterium]
MDFLKKLLGGGGSASSGDKDGLYFYVKAHRTGEVIQVRLNRSNDLSQSDSGGYFARKMIVGQRSFDRIEAEFFFDNQRRFTSAEVTGGELVDQSDYDAYLATKTTQQKNSD